MTNSRIETMIPRLTDVVGTVIPSQCRIIHIPEVWLISWKNTSQLHLGAHFTRCHGPADGTEMAIHIGAIEIVYQVIGIITCIFHQVHKANFYLINGEMLSHQAYRKNASSVDHFCRVLPGLILAPYAKCSVLDGRNTPYIPHDCQTPYAQHSSLVVRNLDERSVDLEKIQGLQLWQVRPRTSLCSCLRSCLGE